MILTKVHITEFQSVLDSNEFEIGDATCLVGKNEAGKTAVLQALYRLNPIVKEDGVYSVTDDYPRRDVEDYRIAVEDGERQQAIVARATFVLDDEDNQAVSAVFGDDVLKSRLLELSKGYDNIIDFDIQVDESATLQFIVEQTQLAPDTVSHLESRGTVETWLMPLRR